MPRRSPPPELEAALRALLGDGLSASTAVREHHGSDESPYPAMPPDLVAFAHNTSEVAEIVRLCAAHKVPVIPYGAGSSLEGHLLALAGGVCIDLSEMNAVVAINPEDLTATVQPGVKRKQLNNELHGTGLFFPIDPGADASIGGMCATRASGTNAVRYGTMRENVLGLTVVTAQGKIIHTGSRARKSSAGYDLTRLFIGSEGTLGIITEAIVKLYPQPEAISAAVVNFPSVDDAVRTVIETIQMGVPVARVEIMDDMMIQAINAYDKMSLRVAPTLFFEFHGSETGVAEQAQTVQEIAAGHGGQDFDWATRPEDRSRLWAARHNAYFAGINMRAGCVAISTDVCVPISRLAEVISETRADLNKSALMTMMVGHVGDGNFHVMMLLDPESAAEREEAEAMNDRLVARAIAADGTCTGEHGVGIHKMRFMEAEHGAEALSVMRQLKQAFDPDNLLNPGKIVPN
ncbi:MAG: FAD-binding protein [Candidatus Protistobacter heckmanni]|nr:FAD-binding protein [Candidatus Protistobacter heckmanni]